MRVELKDSVLNTFRIERDKPVIIDGKWGREIRFDIPVYENEFIPYDYEKIRIGDEVEIIGDALDWMYSCDGYDVGDRVFVKQIFQDSFELSIKRRMPHINKKFVQHKLFKINTEVCLHKDTEYYSKLSPEKRLSKLKVIGWDIMPYMNPMCEHKCFYDEDVYKVEYEGGEIDWVSVREIYRKI